MIPEARDQWGEWLIDSAPAAVEMAVHYHARVDTSDWDLAVACDPVGILDHLASEGFVVVRRELLG